MTDIAVLQRLFSGSGKHSSGRTWVPIIVLPVGVICMRTLVPRWVFMWLLAFAVYFGCKWWTWLRTERHDVTALRSLAYLLAWPGMNAREFFAHKSGVAVSRQDWVRAGINLTSGIFLLWIGVSRSVLSDSLWVGWSGMVGLILILHFGIFEILALAYRSVGVPVTPLMRRPLLSTSVTEFWSARWNSAFNRLVADFVFKPMARCSGASVAAISVFIVSGLVHDLVISLPAGSGYGLPTAYFTLQGLGMLFERSNVARSIGLRHGWRGRLYMLTVTAAPVCLLFPPVFVWNIILPMLKAMNSFWRYI